MASWDDYRFFLAVARHGNHSAAARELGVSQPTVSRRIEQLESALGLTLFQREGVSCAVTLAGREALRFVERIEREAKAIDRCLAQRREGAGHPIRLATTRGLAIWLAPKLTALGPGILGRLEIHVDLRRADLTHHDADLALRMGHPGDEELRGRRLGPACCGLYASRASEGPRPETLEALSQHVEVRSRGELERLPQVRVLRERVDPAPGVGAGCVSVQIALARAGLGFVPLPCFMGDADPALERWLPDAFEVPVDLWVLRHSDRENDPALRSVFDLVVRAAEQDRDLFLGRRAARAGA